MAYRKLPVAAGATVSVPQLSGGLNEYDTPERLNDGQLTECSNMWWKDGALKTRPGLMTERDDARHFNQRTRINERELLLSRMRDRSKDVEFYASLLTAEGGLTDLGGAAKNYYGTLPAEGYRSTALGIRAENTADTDWYFLLSGGDVIKENPEREVTTDGQGWVPAQPYIPTVMINGKGEEYVADTAPTAYEDYNMLTRAFACTYTTDGASKKWKLPQEALGVSEDGTTVAKFELTVADADTDEVRTVEATALWNDGTITTPSVSLTPSEAGVSAAKYVSVVLTFYVNRAKGIVTTQLIGTGTNGTGLPLDALPALTDNNLKITAWRNKKYDKQRLTICRMTRGIWFGGDRSGTEGGTRFFVCGNPDEPNLVHWSGIEHPLYFPENNRVRVGESDRKVVAFGKQGDLLVLFKSREMYALQYVAGEESDTDFAINGGVSVTTYSAKFPVTPIQAGVGCDCPNSIQLVNNRLVWMNSDGRVFMLTATNQYSERNVRMISRNIGKSLTAIDQSVLKGAQAAEFSGYYLLLVGKKVFLLDTQTSAFSGFNYYSDENSARKALAWFQWTLPTDYTYTGIVSDGSTLRLTATIEDGAPYERVFRLEGDTDDGRNIPCRFATRWWDLGRPDAKKTVDELYTNLGCLPGGRVWLTYLTEQGVYKDPYPLRDLRTDEERAKRYLRKARTTPNLRMVQTFGIRFSCDRAMEVDGIHLKVRQQGVVR